MWVHDAWVWIILYTYSHVNVSTPSCIGFIHHTVHETTSSCVASPRKTAQADVNRQKSPEPQSESFIGWPIQNIKSELDFYQFPKVQGCWVLFLQQTEWMNEWMMKEMGCTDDPIRTQEVHGFVDCNQLQRSPSTHNPHSRIWWRKRM
jgi:hypothetical protein